MRALGAGTGLTGAGRTGVTGLHGAPGCAVQVGGAQSTGAVDVAGGAAQVGGAKSTGPTAAGRTGATGPNGAPGSAGDRCSVGAG